MLKGNSMFKCPVCDEKSFSTFEKFNLSPRMWHSCKSCGSAVTVNPKQFFIAFAISVTFMVLTFKFVPEEKGYIAVLVFLILTFLMNYKWINLIQKK
jgi:hypothetical protein